MGNKEEGVSLLKLLIIIAVILILLLIGYCSFRPPELKPGEAAEGRLKEVVETVLEMSDPEITGFVEGVLQGLVDAGVTRDDFDRVCTKAEANLRQKSQEARQENNLAKQKKINHMREELLRLCREFRPEPSGG